MLVSQSILRLLRNAVARWNQCLICGSLRHNPHSDLQCLKNENFWFFSAIFTHLDRSFNIVHLLNPSGYGLLRYGSRRLQNFKVSRCRLHPFSILGGTDIGSVVPRGIFRAIRGAYADFTRTRAYARVRGKKPPSCRRAVAGRPG